MTEEAESNDARLVVRLATVDDDWLAAAGREIGVGKAVVARLLIQWAHRRNLSMYQLMAWLAQASQPALVEASPVEPVMYHGTLIREIVQLPEDAGEPLPLQDVDAIVAAQVAEAERNGQTSARAVAAGQHQFEDAPIRALRVVSRTPGKDWAGGAA